MTLEHQDMIQRSKKIRYYPFILAGAVIAVGSMSNLMSGGFAGSFVVVVVVSSHLAEVSLW